MKTELILLLTMLFCYGCVITKVVTVPLRVGGAVVSVVPLAGNPMHDAIWYTDTISFDGDTIYYFNSDGSEVRIYPPFILIDHTLDK